MLNTPYLKSIFKRAFSSIRSINDCAVRTDVLDSATKLDTPSALYVNETLDRIREHSPWRNPSADNSLIAGGTITTEDVLALELRDVAILGTNMYCGPAYDQIGPESAKLLSPTRSRCEHFDSADFVSTWSGYNFFGCLMHDDFVTELLADPITPTLRMANPTFRHEADYRSLLGLTKSSAVDFAAIRSLRLFIDPPISPGRKQRFLTLQDSLRRSLDTEAPQSQKIIYLQRGGDGEQRSILNEDELIRRLDSRGVHIVNTFDKAATEIARDAIDASMVIGVEGSHLAHSVFTMSDGAGMIVIQPPDRFSMVYKETTDCLDYQFGFTVGEFEGPGRFRVDVDEVETLIDQMLSRL